MYLATAAIGCLLIIIGCLMPHKSMNMEHSITEKAEKSTGNAPSGPDTFSLELLEKQTELVNKKIDTLNERILELENKVQMSISNISSNSDDNTEPVDNDSIINKNDISKCCEDGYGSIKDNNDINSTIYSMYDKGASLDEISSALRIGRGELQLRLGLRKSQKQ